MHDRPRFSLLFLVSLAAGCDLEPPPDEPGAVAREAQALRFGSFSFADPAVGQIFWPGIPWCTATLIDPEVIVTAAHCVAGRTGPFTGTFRVEHSSSVRFEFPLQQVRSFGSGRGAGHSDVAIVRLGRAVPREVAVPFGVNPWAIISMHERLTMYGHGCRAVDGDAYAGRKQRYDTTYDLTIYGCPGDSGGPLLKTMANGTRVVAKVISGKSRGIWPWSDWKAEYGLVYEYARAIQDQADIWAGRPVRPPPQGGGGGGRPPGPNDPPIQVQ